MVLSTDKVILKILLIGFFNHYITCQNTYINSEKETEKVVSVIDVNNNAESISDESISSPTLNMCDSKRCPSRLYHHRSEYKDFCYTFLEPQSFPPKCPYPLFLSLTDPQVEDIYTLFKNTTIWIMAERSTEDGFGPFEWISKDYKHGLAISDYYRATTNIAEKNCLIIVNYKYKPVRCQEKHRALCIYPYDTASISKYCRKLYKNSKDFLTCTADSINTGNHNCYCEMARGGLRDSFCDTLAEPILLHQSDILIHKLPTVHDACWIGLHINESGMPLWNNSTATVNYSCWSLEANHRKHYGALKFIKDAGWILADDDGAVQCGICQLKNVYDKNVTLRIKYNSSNNSVELQVKNPYEISDYFGGLYTLFCFAGPTLDNFKHKVSEPFFEFDDNPKLRPATWVGHFTNEWKFPVYYWCEGYQNPNLKPIFSGKMLVSNSFGGYEYTLRIKVQTEVNRDPYLNETYLKVRNYIRKKLKLEYGQYLRVMKVLNYDQSTSQVEMILHLTTSDNDDEEIEYNNLRTLLRELFAEDAIVLDLVYLERSDVCLPSTTNEHGRQLQWPKTIIGSTTLPLEICLEENGNPVIRKCEGDFINGGFWSEVIGTCSSKKLSEQCEQLYQLYNNVNITAAELSRNLTVLTSNNIDVTVVDIYLISKMMQKLDTFTDEINVTEIVTIASNVMRFEPSELRKAQEMLNCTDNILYSLDTILTKTRINESTHYDVFMSQNLFVQISDIRKTNITGLALNATPSDDGFQFCKIIPLYHNVSIEELVHDQIELASFLPSQLVHEIENCIPSNTPIKLLMMLFYNDVLFNEKVEKTRECNSLILNILIPEFFSTFTTPIPIVFKPLHSNSFEKKCAFWTYGVDKSVGKNSKGHWSEDDYPKVDNRTNRTYAICSFDHVTHFALLMMGSVTKENLSETHVLVLDIVTGIGTVLSLGSIAGIITIAIVSKTWRQRSSNKILLNFSVAIALQMIFLYVANNLNQDGIWCVVTGVTLHYTVLSEFLWMLIIAFLQYRRFVTVFDQQIPNLVGKSCTICWCFPLIPIALLLSISVDCYRKNIHGLCYPAGKCFYLTVLVPVSLIILINFIIYIKIIFALCRTKIKSYGSEDNNAKLQVLLAIFLFFLLGISWIFGIAVGFGGGVLFSYLFCFTATFQGFVMFLIFVVMNEHSRSVFRNIGKALGVKSEPRRNSGSSYSQTQVIEGMDGKSF